MGGNSHKPDDKFKAEVVSMKNRWIQEVLGRWNLQGWMIDSRREMMEEPGEHSGSSPLTRAGRLTGGIQKIGQGRRMSSVLKYCFSLINT